VKDNAPYNTQRGGTDAVGDDVLLTVAETATELGVTAARVHQLLGSGDLRGPSLPPGRARHIPGSGRVTVTSVRELIASRTDQDVARKTSGRPSSHAKRTGRAAAPISDQAAWTAAQEMKVQLDAARETLRAERGRSRKLLAVAAELVALLRSAADAADDVDDIAKGYSAALTQLLSPSDPAGAGDDSAIRD
jgi:hypothetical protein